MRESRSTKPLLNTRHLPGGNSTLHARSVVWEELHDSISHSCPYDTSPARTRGPARQGHGRLGAPARDTAYIEAHSDPESDLAQICVPAPWVQSNSAAKPHPILMVQSHEYTLYDRRPGSGHTGLARTGRRALTRVRGGH